MVLPGAWQLSFRFTADKTLSIYGISMGGDEDDVAYETLR